MPPVAISIVPRSRSDQVRYEVVREGDNGVVCMAAGFSAPTHTTAVPRPLRCERPRPIEPLGGGAVVSAIEPRTRLAMDGKTFDQIAGLARRWHQVRSKGTVTFCTWSAHQYLGRIMWHPHLMVFAPLRERDGWRRLRPCSRSWATPELRLPSWSSRSTTRWR